jgi:hypothetical protein
VDGYTGRLGTKRSSAAGRRVFPRVLAAVLFFAALEGLIFHTGLYPSIIEPNSTTGTVETRLRVERQRVKFDRNQVLAVGHSRMALRPHIANELEPSTGYTFATVSVGGALPRVWYYQLRSLDPSANQYAAILLPSDNYDEPDGYADFYSERAADLHYLVARLELQDLFEFPWSYRENRLRWAAFRGILLKGFVYKQDFLEFLAHSKSRIASVRLSNKFAWQWQYDYNGEQRSLAGLQVDWRRELIQYPDGTPSEKRDEIRNILFPPQDQQAGRQTAYFHYWYGRIVDRYRGSGTKIIFLQVPRAPLPIPGHPVNPHSAIRELASEPGVVVLDEHLFDELERPELFMDGMHLNGAGEARFSQILAREVRRVLGPPKP